jgi:hypothetical protein
LISAFTAWQCLGTSLWNKVHPKGLYGIFYWYSLLTAHDLLFRGMLKAIAEKVKSPILEGPEKFRPGPI